MGSLVTVVCLDIGRFTQINYNKESSLDIQDIQLVNIYAGDVKVYKSIFGMAASCQSSPEDFK